MPNFVDPYQITRHAAAIAADAGLSGELADRFVAIAVKYLRRRPDFAKSLERLPVDAPTWARQSAALGQPLHEFDPPVAISTRLHDAASALSKVSQADSNRAGKGRTTTTHLLTQLHRMSFSQLELALADWRKSVSRQQRDDPHLERCPAAIFPDSQGRSWARVTTLYQLDETGTTLSNCLARSHPGHKVHWQSLRDGSSEFWRLRLKGGRIVSALEIDAETRIVRDVRGSKNQVPVAYESDIRQLMAGLRLKSPPVGEFTGDEALFSLGLVGPAAERVEPDVVGKLGRATYMWAQGGKRYRWSVAFPIVESYEIVGRPKAKDILGEAAYRRLYQRSSATLRTLTDNERCLIADLELRQIATANSWIGIEDEFRLAEASEINPEVERAIARDLAALEGMEAERLAKVKRRAAWIADRFVRERQRAGTIICDGCGFDPAALAAKLGVKPRGFLDVHHKNPLDEGVRYTTTADFALLCPTCHRVEHVRLRRSKLPISCEVMRPVVGEPPG